MDAICDVTGKYVCWEPSKSNVQKTFYVMYMVFQQGLGVKSQIVSENSFLENSQNSEYYLR